MANQPIDLPPCINLKLSASSNEKSSSLENSAFEFGDSHWTGGLFGNATALLLLQGNSTYIPTTSQDGNFSSTPPVLQGPTNLLPVDSLITHPGYQTLTAFSILGNLVMISVILFLPQFRKPANYLIVNLSLSSILFIISANLRLMENVYDLWSYSTFRCQLLAVIHRIPIPCVALTTMGISLDRGRVARNPMNCSNVVTPAWKIIFIWTFSVLIVTPLAFTRVYDECIPAAYKCAKILLFERPTLSMLYGFVYMMSIHVIPAVILLHESVKTQKIMKFLKLTISTQQQVECRMIPSYSGSLSDNRLRLLRNSCLFTTIFLVFWLPYGIFQFPLDLPREILPELLEVYVRFYFRFIRNFTYVQIALNPVILFALSYDLRMYLRRVQLDWTCRMQTHTNNRRYNYCNDNHILRLRQQPP